MSTERPCFHAKSISPRGKGCPKEAKFRVLLGNGHTIDVCEDHVTAYRGLGYKIIELEKVEV